MQQQVSKSELKPRLLEYLRKVQENKLKLVITHFGEPVAEITPYIEGTDRAESEEEILRQLRSSVLNYADPTGAVGEDDWEALK